MIYLVLPATLIVLCLVLKISARYLYLLAGVLVFLHPLLLAKGQIANVQQLSIIVFLIILSALVIDAIARIIGYRLDEQDPFIMRLIRRSLKIRIKGVRIGNRYIGKYYVVAVQALLCILLFWKVGVFAAIFGMALLVFIINEWDSRIIAGCALLCLGACPFLLLFHQEALAESFAVYAYYVLVLTVILLVVEQVREQRLHEKD